MSLAATAAGTPTTTTPPAGGVVLSGMRCALGGAALLVLLAALGGCRAPAPLAPDTGPDGGAIAAIQGRGGVSPRVGEQVEFDAVVSAPMSGLQGFFAQDLRGDGDPATADGLFVAWPHGDPLPAAGARVRIAGQVAELGDAPHTLTAVRAGRVEVLGSGPLPAPVALRVPVADWEALEGMRVRIDVPLTVTGNHALARFGELAAVFGERLWQPTELHRPGPEADALARADAARTLLLDDARASQNPRRLWQLPEPLSPAAPLRAGSRVHGIEGVLDQRFGSYRIQPTRPFARIDQAPRPRLAPVDGPLRLAVLNVLNFFDGDGRGGGFPTARGADSVEEFERQRAKLLATLVALDADIVALLEIENDGNGDDSSLATLTAALNAAQPRAGYAFVPTPAPGGDAIRVALLYRTHRVTAVGRTAQLGDGPFAYGSRPPLVQAFDLGRGAPLVVAVNHFKSKGGCDDARGADADRGDLQGCWNAARTAAATALARWLQQDPTGTGSARVLLVGDLNAYAQEDPLRSLHAHGYQDVFAAGARTPHYSYVYQGRAGRLDHALASPAALPLVTGATVWHANADEADAFDYNLDGRRPLAWYRPDPWRASDHDPLLLGLSPH